MRKPPLTKKATLVDVAKAAGVGPMTVSRTINGHPYVSEATAKRVHAAIRKLDYRPNHAARMLTGQLSKSIGLIVPDIADPFFSVVSRAVQKAAREAGYLVWLAVSDDDPSTEEAEMEQMMHHPVDGILLAPIDSRSKHLKTAAAASIPIVTIDRPIEIASTDSVEVENRLGAHMVMEHLRSHGYKRIACVATDFHLRSIKLRVAAYEEYLRRERLPRKKLVLKSEADVLPAMRSLFSSADPPDALFTTNNICTTTVIQALHGLGIRLQRDVALIGFDDVDFYSLLKPSITTISQPVAELGRAATRLLFDRIQDLGPSSHVRLVLPVSLVLRESCGCKNNATIC
jgi:LacI family transcriptional regulator